MLKALAILIIFTVTLSSISACGPEIIPNYVGGECDHVNAMENPQAFCEIHLIEDDSDEWADFDDEDYEDYEAYDEENEDDIDYDCEDYEDEEDYDDEDFEDEEDWEDEEDYDDEDDEDYEDYEANDFDYMKYKIFRYLEKFGSIEENWHESEDFNNSYKAYLEDNSSYCLDEANENYETHLKIYNSVLRALEDKNFTEEETNYLKFLLMYFLNNADTSNYTWNEEDDFENFIDDFLVTCMAALDTDKNIGSNYQSNKENNDKLNFIKQMGINSIDSSIKNSTDNVSNNLTDRISDENIGGEENPWMNTLLYFLMVILAVLVIVI